MVCVCMVARDEEAPKTASGRPRQKRTACFGCTLKENNVHRAGTWANSDLSIHARCGGFLFKNYGGDCRSFIPYSTFCGRMHKIVRNVRTRITRATTTAEQRPCSSVVPAKLFIGGGAIDRPLPPSSLPSRSNFDREGITTAVSRIRGSPAYVLWLAVQTARVETDKAGSDVACPACRRYTRC